ncbi:MAG: hypothetical protein JWR69_1780 [Pedosphaera sp.]|nr:hypothetical protein [Pedosphaera sp.]
MKKALMLAMLALGLAGCATSDDRGRPSPGYETGAAQGRSSENDQNGDDGGWKGWPYGGDPDRIAPHLPLDPTFPPSPTPPVPLPPD